MLLFPHSIHSAVCDLPEEEAKKALVLPLPPSYTLGVLEKHGGDSITAEGLRGEKACLVTTDTGASVMIARPDDTAGLPETDPNTPYIL